MGPSFGTKKTHASLLSQEEFNDIFTLNLCDAASKTSVPSVQDINIRNKIVLENGQLSSKYRAYSQFSNVSVNSIREPQTKNMKVHDPIDSKKYQINDTQQGITTLIPKDKKNLVSNKKNDKKDSITSIRKNDKKDSITPIRKNDKKDSITPIRKNDKKEKKKS